MNFPADRYDSRPTIDCAKCGDNFPQENGPVCPHCGNDHSGQS